MSDDGKCYAATPAATLEEHIVNSNVAKSDTEWWAHHEITRLRAENEKLREALQPFADKATQWGGQPERQITVMLSECRRARAAIEGVTEPQR